MEALLQTRDALAGNLWWVTPASTGARPIAVIFDMDGTLCDVRSIRHHLAANSATRSKRNFHAFHSASIDCPPHPQVVALARELSAAGVSIVIATAREAKWSFHTALWLEELGIPYDAMLMRENGDYRPDVEVKRSLLSELLVGYTPVAALDDRDDVIGVWREGGISTLKVTEGGEVERSALPAVLKSLLGSSSR